MELKIYGKDGNLKLTASPGSSSTLAEEVMGECSVSASFTHTAFVPLDVNDYTEVLGVKYKIRSPYRPAQKNTHTYQYQVKLYAPIHDAEDALMLYTADGDIRSEFSYDGGPREHLQLWVDNMNRIAGGTLWTIGTVITGGNKTIDYNNMLCWNAAFGSSGIAAAFETEMWADGFVINLCKASRGETVELGYLQGLTQLSQEDNGDVKFFTRLFPLGSTRNIDASKYGHARLQLPSGAAYVDKNTELYGVKEAYEEAAFAGIYPKYTGTISSVRTEEKENEEGRKYTVYYFKDSSMAFNPMDYQIPDLTFMLAFQTGDLAGRGNGEDGSFEAAWHEDTSEWEITNVYPDETAQIPGGSIVPNAGDTYIPWNFSLPQEYVTAAEQAYAAAVDDFLDTYSFDTKKYNGTTDRNYIERNGTSLAIGQNVRLLSEEYFSTGYKDTRIVKCVRKLNDLSQATVTCTDQIGTGWKTSVDNQLSDLHYILTKQEQQTLIDIIKTGDNKTPSDYNVFSALKALAMFLRKDKEDATNYLLRLLGGAHFFPFTQGMIGGSGAAFYKNAAGKTYMEADGAYLRDELVVPKITFNCIDVISGDKANTFAFGTIKSVDTENKTAELDLLEDQTGTLHVNDICRGVFHNLDGSNLQDDMEDANGFYGYAGFSTSYFTPTEIVTNEPGKMVFRYSLQAGTSVHPMKGMNFFAYGNFTDKTRQSITYETRYYTRRLKDVNTWVIDPTKNISMQDGLLEGLTIGGMVMHGYGTFQENCYFTGVNIQFTPDTEEALKGQDAYSVSLSSYERVVKTDEDGNIVSLLEALNVVTGDENVITGDKNVITEQKRIQTHVQAFKGSAELLYSEAVEAGAYVVTLSPQGCTASVEGGIVSIDSITATENCFVDIQVNCEGNAVFDKRFSVSIIRDGSDAYTLDLDNEMASVACDAEGNAVAGLPVTSGVAFYKGTKPLPISNVAVEAPAGVTCSVDEETHAVTVSAIGKDVPESFGITVTVTALDDNVPVTRSTVMTVLKMKAGENATLYQLAPSVNIVKIDKEGNYSESYVACSVRKTDGKNVEILTALPEGITLSVRKDGLAEQAYSLNDDIATDGLSRSVEFRLKQDGTLIDTETVPVVADGTDGFTNVIADLDNEMASVACDADGKVTAGLPIVSTVRLYYGTEEMELDSLEVEEPAGVTASADKATGKITVSAIADYTPDMVSLPVTCSGTFGGQSYERTAYIKINKVKPGANGENAVIYSLIVEPSTVKIDKNGDLSVSSVSCKVRKTDGSNSSVAASLPDGYSIHTYVDGSYEDSYTSASVTANVDDTMQSVGFRLMDGTTVMDEETVPVVRDGIDGLGSVTLDLDNEMASVACNESGGVVNGLPITVNFSMFFGTEEMEITSITNAFVSGLIVTNSASESKSTVTSISSSAPDTIELEYAVRGMHDRTLYERKAVFRILKVSAGKNGENAVIYQLLPSQNVIKVNKNGSYVNSSISCGVTKNDGGKVSTVTSLPSGMSMTIQQDSDSETSYTRGSSVSVTSASEEVSFRLYIDNVLADMETVPVVKDGTDGQDGQDGANGRPGSDGADGKQGIQGCVIRTSIWASGREYRNDSGINDDSIIRYIDVALTQANTDTGWRAYRCKKTHTSSGNSASLYDTEYWEEFSENVSAIFTDLIIAKNAQLAFMQGNRIIIVDEDNGITAGMSGYSDGIRFWAGSQMPDDAPFRVDYKGRVWATDGTFSGDLSAKMMTLKRNTSGTSEAINGALVTIFDELGRFPEISGDDVMVIEILYPLMTRTIETVTLMGVNSNVYFAPDNDVPDAVSSLTIGNIQGCYFRCFGFNFNGKTYWSVMPMNDQARIELENA